MRAERRPGSLPQSFRDPVAAAAGTVDRLFPSLGPASAGTFHRGKTSGQRTAWILSFTGVSNEPRVLRQAASLLGHGWNVVVLGYDGHSPRPHEWSFLRLPDMPRSRSVPFRAALKLQRWLGRLLYRGARAWPAAAQLGARLHYFGLPNWRQNHAEIVRLAAANDDLAGDLVIAHDHHVCPPAYALARQWGAAFLIDAHEYSRSQFMENADWVRDGRYYDTALQDYYFARADAVTTVSEGIAELLNSEQSLKRPVCVLRSMPDLLELPLRPPGSKINVLYHGLICSDRGLEEAVRSVALWRPEFEFTLRGPGDRSEVDRLIRLAAQHGVADRIRFEPPVSFDRIVPAANTADIGYFVQHDYSPQKRFTLPNKFFEYVMAGLALCVSDLPEMARYVRQYKLGVLVPAADPALIAAAVNSLDRQAIMDYKRASLQAARALNWQAEEKRMLELLEEVLASRGPARACR